MSEDIDTFKFVGPVDGVVGWRIYWRGKKYGEYERLNDEPTPETIGMLREDYLRRASRQIERLESEKG